jgi:uncharacterized membrane protein YdfJ with MMPL/SSD domain
MLAWFGKAIYRARWFVLALALVAVGAAGWYGVNAFDAFDNSIGSAVQQSDSAQAQHMLDTQLSAGRVDIVVLFQSNTLTVNNARYRGAVQAALAPLQGNPAIAAITTYYSSGSAAFVSNDKQETFAAIRLQDASDPQDVYGFMRQHVTSPTLHVSFGGSVPADQQFSAQTRDDLSQMEYISLPIVALALVFVFGGLVAALLPLLIGVVAILGALAALHGLTNLTPISVFAVDIVALLGLGLAIDYSLFIITRFREEMAQGQVVRDALARTMQTAGRTVFFSGLTVSMCLLGMLFFPLATLHSLGLGAVAAVLVAMLAALTILPAILAALGRRVDALSLRRLLFWRKSSTANVARDEGGVWYRLSQFVMRFPVPVVVLTLALLIGLGLPFTQVNFAAPDVRALPTNQSARQVADRLLADFPQSDGSTQNVVLRTPGNALSPANLAALAGYVQSIEALPNVTQVTSIVSLVPGMTEAQYEYLYAHPAKNPRLIAAARALANGDATTLSVTVAGQDNSTTAQNAVTALRHLAPPAGFTAYVGGTTAEQMDLFAALTGHLLPAILVIVLSTFVLLFLMTGSLVVPLKAIVLNCLSLTATLGAIVFVFQQGHGENLLNFQALGSIDPSQMMILFTVAFGLSMDYEVFLLSRIKEHYDLTGNNRLAVATGLQRTGRLITSAALLLAIVLLSTAASQIIFIKELGLGLALAVIMDATVVRALLVPATMRILGRWNWWPRARAFGERDVAPESAPVAEPVSAPLAPERIAALAAALGDRDPDDSAEPVPMR